MKLVLAITGASGVVYGVRLAEELRRAGVDLSIVITKAAKKIFNEELPEGLKRFSTVDFIVGNILDALGVEHSLFRRWNS